MFSNLQYRLWVLFRRNSMEAELDTELRAHIEQQAERYVQAGISPEDAARRARLEFGAVEQVKEECRDSWGVRFVSELGQNLRYGLRQLRRNPGFTAVAVLTLALGIGSNTAIFTLIDSLMLRPLPVREPGQLVEIWSVNSHSQTQRGLFSLPMFEDLRQRQNVFSSAAAWGAPFEAIGLKSETVPGAIETVTPDYFPMLGASPLIGRFFGPDDVSSAKASYTPAVISYRFWRERFGGNQGILGKTIRVFGKPCTIVGVAKKDFFGVFVGISADVWVPAAPPLFTPANLQNRNGQGYWLTARLKKSVSVQQAQAQLVAIWPPVLQATAPEGQTPQQRSDFMSQRLRVVPAKTGILASSLLQFRQPVWLLMGAVALVLLIACLNLANLMLARAAARRHEMGVRLALGATRRRVASQMLTESLMLSVAGALLGGAFAYWTSDFLTHFIWTGIVPLAVNLSPDFRVLGFTVVLTVMVGILFGQGPAWFAARQNPSGLLQHGPRTLGTSRNRQRYTSGLIIVQIALSLVLLDVASSFIYSLGRLDSVKPGFRTRGLILIQLQEKKHFDAANYWPRLIRQVSAIPGVLSVSLAEHEPLLSPLEWTEPVSAKSGPGQSAGPISSSSMAVSPGFFETLGITLLQGRVFNPEDGPKSVGVAIISRSLSERLFPDGRVLGQLISIGESPREQNLRVVGIVNDARLHDLRNAVTAEAYVPLIQQEPSYLGADMQVQTGANSAAVARTIVETVNKLDNQYPLWIHFMHQQVEKSIVRERTLAMLSWFFGPLALLLAAIGLYGLVSYAVRTRTQEIGIRMALGAQRRQILHLVLRGSLVLVLTGICIGVPIALAASRLISGMLYEVSPGDIGILLLASIILFSVTVLSAYVPGRRAAKVDPMVALRYE